jgi:hypothetical protein
LILIKWAFDEGWFDNTLLALYSLEKRLSKPSTSHSHGESGGTGTGLGLNDFVTTKLDAANVVIKLLALEVEASLAEEGNNRYTAVSTDNCDVLIGWVAVLDLADESAGTDNIESRNTEELLWVIDAMCLENFGGDWYG